jgi:uncharacterized protein (TIGR00255 family)
MTGFARREGGDGAQTWVWEAKSVNGKGLDLRARLPQGFEALEPQVRAALQRVCARGNVNVSLTVDRGERPLQLQVNRTLLEQLVGLTRELQDELNADPPRIDGLLAVRGVLESVEQPEPETERAARERRMAADLEALADELAAVRRREGESLDAAIRGHLDEIARLTRAAADNAASQPAALRERLRRQVAELMDSHDGLSEERLNQEAALLATKADVREELDRLSAHVDAARELLDGGGAIGRRLDFLCQELNREANTLCSKSPDVALTRTGLAIKNAIEQLREQVQNVE